MCTGQIEYRVCLLTLLHWRPVRTQEPGGRVTPHTPTGLLGPSDSPFKAWPNSLLWPDASSHPNDLESHVAGNLLPLTLPPY